MEGDSEHSTRINDDYDSDNDENENENGVEEDDPDDTMRDDDDDDDDNIKEKNTTLLNQTNDGDHDDEEGEGDDDQDEEDEEIEEDEDQGENGDENEEEEEDGDDDDDEEIDDNDDENEDKNGDEDEDEETASKLSVGGTIAKEALCLLDGFIETDEPMTKWERLTLPIKRLPATIGRSHPTNDKNFVGLGGNQSATANSGSPNGKNNYKAVSRQHIRIDYRVPTSSGSCGHIQTKVGFRSEFFYNFDDPVATSDIRIVKSKSTSTSSSVLPATGFYTLTCLGKNRVLVNKTRIDPNQTVWIQSGSAIRIANHLLYFVTPKITDDMERKTIQIRDDFDPIAKKRKLSLGVSTARPAVIGTGTGEGIVDHPNEVEKVPSGIFRGSASKSMQSEIESLSTKKLLQEMQAAYDEDIWDRRHQLIGSTLSYRAVVEASYDTEWYEREGGTVSRSAVMEWIASSDKFGEWVEHMLSKLEQKSYQASITKGMIKAGYIRTTSSGRYIKWIVPRANVKKNDKDNKQPPENPPEEEEDENDEDGEDEDEEDDDDNHE